MRLRTKCFTLRIDRLTICIYKGKSTLGKIRWQLTALNSEQNYLSIKVSTVSTRTVYGPWRHIFVKFRYCILGTLSTVDFMLIPFCEEMTQKNTFVSGGCIVCHAWAERAGAILKCVWEHSVISKDFASAKYLIFVFFFLSMNWFEIFCESLFRRRTWGGSTIA